MIPPAIGSLVCKDSRYPGLVVAIDGNYITVEWPNGRTECKVYWAYREVDAMISGLEFTLANAHAGRERARIAFGPRIPRQS
jgi:expansin (peptidoglycan-binding protein)